MTRDYRKLIAFQLADNLAKEIYIITKKFPREEKFSLTSQLRRAAVSVPANIVEGSHRNSLPDFVRFLDISLGSLAETGYLLEFSSGLGYLDTQKCSELMAKHDECIKVLKGLYESLRNKV